MFYILSCREVSSIKLLPSVDITQYHHRGLTGETPQSVEFLYLFLELQISKFWDKICKQILKPN